MSDDQVRPLTAAMRNLLWLAGGLVTLAGIQLFVFTERTDQYFAWTIDPPLTAAFLGAAYWASVAFEWAGARERHWANARITVPTVFVFTTMTLVVTLVHLDRFHLGPEFGPVTRLVTWIWLLIYTTVPVLMAILWWSQGRRPGADPDPGERLPAPIRAVLAVHVVVLGGYGLGLLIAPTTAAQWWPWALTPLTARAIGAWLLSLGVAAAHALGENRIRRLRPAAYAYTAFAVLQTVALLRYPDSVAPREVTTLVYLLFLASTLYLGVAGLSANRGSPPPAPR